MSFASSPEEHAKLDSDAIAVRLAPSSDAFVLGAFTGQGELIGIVGVYRQAPASRRSTSFWNWGRRVPFQASRPTQLHRIRRR